MIKDLIQKIGSTLKISFQSTIDTYSFEKLLAYAYPLSKKTTHKKVVFDFSKVYWCDVLQLSMIALWLQELKDLGKDLTVQYPKIAHMIIFFEQYGFDDFLSNIKATTDHSMKSTAGKNYSNKPFLPLTFLDTNEFNDLLNNLSNEDYFNVLFDEVSTVALAKRGLIKDVILKELGDNMYSHGNGRFANIIMTKQSHHKRQLQLLEGNNPLDISIKESNFLTFVISDKGQGIYKKLLSAYKDDVLIDNKNSKPSHSDLIEYATYEHSTSRTTSERLKLIEDIIADDLENIDPFTGLFQIRETIKRHKGVLLIRSGNAFTIFNYNKGKEIISKSSDIKGFKELANFGGTQIKVVLPIINDFDHFYEASPPSFIHKETDKQFNYRYLRLDNFFVIANNFDAPTLAREYSNFKENIKQYSYDPNIDGIIVDFKNRVTLDSKIQFLIISILIKLQELHHKIHTVLNIDSNIVILINQSLQNKKINTLNPLVIFDEDLTRDIIGLKEYDRQLFKNLQNIKSFESEEQIIFVSRYNFLFSANKLTDEVEFKHNRRKILLQVISYLLTELRLIISDPQNTIYNPHLKVLTQNGIYFESYYEVNNLVKNPSWRQKVKEWIFYQTILLKPSHIFSLSHYYGVLINEMIAESKNDTICSLKHINLKTPLVHEQLSELPYLVIKKAIICTDVIATGYSIRDIFEFIDPASVSFIISLVNVTDNKWINSNFKFQVTSIISAPISSYQSKPDNWLYEEIHSTDSETHQLLKPSAEKKLLGDIPKLTRLQNLEPKRDQIQIEEESVFINTNPFLNEIVVPNDAYFIRVISEGKYMPVKFNIPIIINKLENEVTQDLLQSISYLESKFKVKLKHFIYFDNKNQNNFKIISRNIIKSYPQLQLHNLSYNHLEAHYQIDFLQSGVIIFDDAFLTGENIFRMLDYCEKNNASIVFIYILIKRSTDRIANRLQKINNYGTTKVFIKYLFDVEIPAYPEGFNPITKTINEYKAIFNRYQNFQFSQYIENRIARTTYADFNTITTLASKQEDYKYFIRLRWKIEQAKNHLADRKDLASILTKGKNKVRLLSILATILCEEKSVFLDNISFLKSFFYPKFKDSITEILLQLLNESLVGVEVEYRQDIILTLIYIDETKFINFLKSEAALNYLLDTNEKLFPLLSALILSPKTLNLYSSKIDFINKIIKSSEQLEQVETPFLVYLKGVWINEKNEYFGDFYKEKVNYITKLLKVSFHEVNKRIDYLREAIVIQNVNEIEQLWDNLYGLINAGFETLQLLFHKENYGLTNGNLNNKVNALRNDLLLIQGMLKIKTQPELLEINDQLIFKIGEFEENLLGSDGLVRMLENEFRTELKEILVFEKEQFQKKNIEVTLDFSDNSCVAFIRKMDFKTIISNLRENIIQHSGASKVLITLTKIAEAEEHLILLNIFDDGKRVDVIEEGVGISLITKTAFIYSGSCKVEKLSTSDSKYILGYRTVAELIFHDLSKEILNTPQYD